MSSEEREDESAAASALLRRLQSLDATSVRLMSDWAETAAAHAADDDAMVSLYEFARHQLILRDGVAPSMNGSRRGSLDPAKDGVMREVAEGLRREKSDYVASFIREWIDSSDDPNGIIFETPTASSVCHSTTSTSGKDETALASLLSWDNDYLSYTHSELVSRSVQIFHHWGFFDSASLVTVPRDKLSAFVRLVGKNYRASNPYHNFHHAHSVLAIAGNLLRTASPNGLLFTHLEELAVLTAALCHDVGHQALSSDFYIKTRHELAVQYNDISVLENMHCSMSFNLLRNAKTDFTTQWTEDQWGLFRRTFIQSVLATDMKSHFELTAKMTELKSVPPETLSPEQKKTIYLSIVHAADLANPVMSTKACYDWAFRVVEEMHEQGRLEEKAGYPVAPFMRHPPTETVEFAKLQISFVGFIVAPLWRSMAAIWPVLDDRVVQMDKNLRFWEGLRDNAVVVHNRSSSAASDVTRCDSHDIVVRSASP